MKGKGLKRNETPGMQSRGRFSLQPPYVGECKARALGMRIVELSLAHRQASRSDILGPLCDMLGVVAMCAHLVSQNLAHAVGFVFDPANSI